MDWAVESNYHYYHPEASFCVFNPSIVHNNAPCLRSIISNILYNRYSTTPEYVL